MKTENILQEYNDDLQREDRLAAILHVCFFLIIIFSAFVLLILNLIYLEIDRIIDSRTAFIDMISFNSFQSLLII
jgi:heme exporter protein D